MEVECPRSGMLDRVSDTCRSSVSWTATYAALAPGLGLCQDSIRTRWGLSRDPRFARRCAGSDPTAVLRDRAAPTRAPGAHLDRIRAFRHLRLLALLSGSWASSLWPPAGVTYCRRYSAMIDLLTRMEAATGGVRHPRYRRSVTISKRAFPSSSLPTALRHSAATLADDSPIHFPVRLLTRTVSTRPALFGRAMRRTASSSTAGDGRRP